MKNGHDKVRRMMRAAILLTLTGLWGTGSAMAKDVSIPHAKGTAVLHSVPAKVAVYELATLDNIHALGIDAVAGVPKGADGKGNFPPYLSDYSDANYRNIGTLFEPDVAALTALKPDLIVIGGRSAKQYAALAQIAPTIDMSSSSKDVVALTTQNVRKLGEAFERSDAAEKRIAAFEAQIASLHAQSAQAGTGLLLFAAGQGVAVHAPGDRFGHVYDFVGIRPAISAITEETSEARPAPGSPEAEAARRKQQERLAAALSTDPTWLFVIDRNAATGNAPSMIREKLAADARIAATSAWKAGRVVYLDPKIWYLVGAGIDALSQSATDTLATLKSGGK